MNKQSKTLDSISIKIAFLPWHILIGWFTAKIATIETSISNIKGLMPTSFYKTMYGRLADAPSLKYHFKNRLIKGKSRRK